MSGPTKRDKAMNRFEDLIAAFVEAQVLGKHPMHCTTAAQLDDLANRLEQYLALEPVEESLNTRYGRCRRLYEMLGVERVSSSLHQVFASIPAEPMEELLSLVQRKAL